MGLFVSYSSRDGAALAKVTAALRRAHMEAWLDEELTGGEAWWNAILEQIRGCEVFIVALSKNYLESKPCQAELRYAQELNRPILPVQIGPLDSMRVNPLASVQAIDYQNPSIESGIELIAAVHARKATAVPLPSPLPEPPPVPFAYLMRLDTAIAAPDLTAAEQAQLFSDLKSGLDTDGNEPSARRDLIQLLIRLRDRPDITWKIRTDIEKELTSIQAEDIPPSSRSTDVPRAPSVDHSPPPSPVWAGGAPLYGAGPAPSSGGSRAATPIPPGPPFGSQPIPMPPFASQDANGASPRKSRKRWIIAGAALAAVAAAVTVVILIIPTPNPPPKPAPKITAGQLNSILLTAARINTIMGASHMQAGDVLQKMANESTPVLPANCVGALYTGENATYGGSDWSGVSDQSLQQQSPRPNTDVGHFFADQTAVLFSSADKAEAFFNTSANNWKSCAGSVTVTNGNDQTHWNLGDLTQTDTKIVQSRTQEGGDWGCQHSLRALSNLIVEVVTCSLQVNDQASQIVDEMIANATH
jgi:serine/threonine kinase PknH